MLRQTFIHLEGIGEATERQFWDAGLREWSDFQREDVAIPRVGAARRSQLRKQLQGSEENLAAANASYFNRLLPARERWRLCSHFMSRVAYVDIETTGMGASAQVTVIGMYAGGTAEVYVRGINLDDFPKAIEPYDVWVSYNGLSFDAPFIAREFGRHVAPAAHIDLMYVLRSVGLKGGLKNVERTCGIARDDDLQELDGWDAVRLWREFRRGRVDSLRTLTRYNLEDIVNLEALLEIGVNRHIEERSLPFEKLSCKRPQHEQKSAAAEALSRLGESAELW